MDRIEQEWIENEWVVVADSDPVRFAALSATLVAVGFVREKLVHARTAEAALDALAEKSSAIAIVDESIGTAGFREIHARLAREFGDLGFFLFAITEGKTPDFVQFSAAARIDGIIFRPYQSDEFRRRIAEVFSVKWPNRVVETPESRAELLVRGKGETEDSFARAVEKEKRLGRRDPLTPDSKVASLVGLRSVSHPAVRPGAASFERVRLSFKAVARNGDALAKNLPIHVLEIDEDRATFECAEGSFETGDHVTIEADITHGEETYLMRIEALVETDSAGHLTVAFDRGNRSRFEAAMKMVAKRFRELKDFFKYAKGA